MKIHQCSKPYRKAGKNSPTLVKSGEYLFEDDKGTVYRLVRGVLVPLDDDGFVGANFVTTDWETASQSPGSKKDVKKKAAKKAAKKDTPKSEDA